MTGKEFQRVEDAKQKALLAGRQEWGMWRRPVSKDLKVRNLVCRWRRWIRSSPESHPGCRPQRMVRMRNHSY